MANSDWKEIGQGGDTWDYANKENPMKKGTEFIGTYLSKEENVGENNTTLYGFEDEGGNFTQVWGCTLLDTRLKNVKEGEQVKIIYLGREESLKRKGKTYHNFQVFHRATPFQEVTDEDKSLDDIEPGDI